MSSLLITGGRVIDPADGSDSLRDLLLEDGVIRAIANPGQLPAGNAREHFDATGCVVAPGLVDVHVHLREPGQTYKETIATGTRAAAAGGFTTVVAMPNTLPVNDSVETLHWMLAPERHPAIRLYAMTAATTGSLGKSLTDFESLAKAGALGFTDDGKPILEPDVMKAAVRRAAHLGLPVSQHAEDPRLSNGAVMNAGPVAFRLGLRGYPNIAESSIVERDIRLVRELFEVDGLRAHLHVQHVSTAEALAAIRSAKADGLHVTCEAAPHHFALTDAAIADFDTNAKMNPPLRSEADRQAVIAALLDGTVDCIATDHAPHALHEKEVEFERAPNGITGIETSLGLALRILHHEHGMPLPQLLKLMSTAPARLLKLEAAASLATGTWADLIVFKPETECTFHAHKSISRSRNTPFDGWNLRGTVEATIVRGEIVFRA